MNERTAIGGNSPPPLEAFGLHIEELFSLVSGSVASPISTDDQEAALDALLDDVRKAKKGADEQRAAEKKPHDDAGKAVQAAYPKATLVQYDPATAGTPASKGLNVQYDLSDADLIVTLDADFLSGASFPGFHKLVREYADRRKDPEKLNRLYSIESTPTTTGLKAEHRLGLRASEVPAFVAELAKAVGVAGVAAPAYAWTDEQKKFLSALA